MVLKVKSSSFVAGLIDRGGGGLRVPPHLSHLQINWILP